MEIVYGNSNSAPAKDDIPDATVIEWLQPIHEAGVKIFRRIYEPMDKATADKHFIDGFCIKGLESAGFSGYTPVKELFLAQKELTPDAYLVPYGGVGTPEQVKEYIDLGAEIVAVGTLLALSAESPIKQATKLAVINAKKEDLSEFNHTFRRNGDTEVVRKQTALKFKEFQGTDNVNHTESLKYGLWKEDTDQGHIYAGHSIDKVTEVLPCKKIIQNLVAEL